MSRENNDPIFGFETLAIHAGAQPEPVTGARQTPIYQNTSYVFHDADHAASLFNLMEPGFVYSRLSNPTNAVLEERLAALEGGVGATVVSSGHAAQVLALFPIMQPGCEVVAANKLYGGSLNQMGNSFKKFGWKAIFVDPGDPENFQRALTADTRAIFVESLANPGGIIVDLAAIAAVANSAGIPFIVDNTMATPYLCRSIDFGADIVVNSTTKFLSGNGTSLGGAVIDTGKFPWQNHADMFPSLARPAPEYHGLTFAETFGNLAYTTYAHAVSLRDLGASQQPLNAWLTLLGLETLPLRMERHCANALSVASWLEQHPAVAWVSYSSLPSSPFHTLQQKYMPKGGGSVFTLGLKGGYDAGLRMVESVELFSHLANIGDARSLILHPASTTHRQLTNEQRVAAGAGDEVIRLSIGLETVDDLIADLDKALRQALL
ncbi:MAG: O-acetylhomoserine aminocarboxypropyltransferase [Rhodospirillaceae bacterium]|nr:O-acetylhomoserine aminocarboxypropyltransferase [Rhodospirillaceae bacterium]